MSIKNLKYFVIPLLVFFMMLEGFSYSTAQTQEAGKEELQIETDHSKIKVEEVPGEKIEDFRNDDDFIYLVPVQQGFDFWSMFWRWFNKLWLKFFSNEGVAPFIRYGIVFLVVAFVIYKIVGGNLSGVFNKNKKVKSTNGFEYFEEDIHQSDIDKKLNEAIQERNFRSAVRYYYLILLKKLDAKELIEWELGKTNRDYQRELKEHQLLDSFIKLSGAYEYSWYGNFEVNEEKFKKWQRGFNDVFESVE